jgi:hypothetical protein
MIENYSHEKHEPMVRKWLEDRGLAVPPPSWYPDRGIVVDDIVCAFLSTTNSKVAMIENIAGDPEADPLVRDTACVRAIQELEFRAKQLGYEAVITMTGLPSMKDRFRRLSYVPSGEMTLYYRQLV